MTIKEMHIYLDQATQKLSTNQGRRIFPGLKDMVLNVAISRFMNQFRPQRGEIVINNQFELDKLRTLITSRELDVYVEGNKGYGILPPDYMHLLSDSSKVKTVCEKEEAVTNRKYIKMLPLPKTTASSPFNILLIKEGNDTVFNIAPYGVKFSSPEEEFAVIDLILQDYKGEIYWERYGSLFAERKFIIVSDNNKVPSITVDALSATGEVTESSFKVYEDTEGDYMPNRLLRNSEVPLASSLSFLRSSPRSHISYIENNKLYILFSRKSIVTKLLISYIRKPIKIGLSLNRSSDLPQEVHSEICDLAVEILKKWVQDPSYNIEVNDNQLRNS